MIDANVLNNLSMYIVNNTGDNTPPCLTPLLVLKNGYPLLTRTCSFFKIAAISLAIEGHTYRSIKHLNIFTN